MTPFEQRQAPHYPASRRLPPPELTLAQLLDDPMVHLVMRRDRLSPQEVAAVMQETKAKRRALGLSPTDPVERRAA